MSRQLPTSESLPLSDLELELLFERLGTPERGRELVRQIRSSQPVRRIASTRYRSAVRKPSRKMGRVLQCKSHRIQLPYLMKADMDPDVHEIYDQPARLPLEYFGKDGRKVPTTEIPDFFMLFRDSLDFVVCKTPARLAKLVEENPGRWQVGEDGKYRSEAGEKATAAYGCGYRVWSTQDAPWVLLENTEFLRDFADEACPLRGKDELAGLRVLVKQQTGVSVEELVDQTGDPELVFFALARGELSADLENQRLARPETVRVFTDRLCAHVWETATASVPAGPYIGSDSVSRAIAESLRESSDTAQGVALQRYEIIKDVLEGRTRACDIEGVSHSTISRWVVAYRTAARDLGSGLLGLLSRTDFRGNFEARFVEPVRQLLKDIAEKAYEVPSRPTKLSAYRILESRCLEAGHEAPSYRSWCSYLASRNQKRQKAKREGQPVADADTVSIPDGEESLLPEGTRPFHVVHIDHTKLDLFLDLRQGRDGRTRKKQLARVWLTIAFCAWSRCVLGYYLSFDAPSYRSCMGALRDMVRHHERLPEVIVVDNAKEFQSKAFQFFCAAYGITQQFRPKSAPKYGASCERVFGTANKQFVHNLMGNTQALRDPRSMSCEVDPRVHAVWTLAKFEEEFRRFFFKTYATTEHGTFRESPRERLERGWRETGQRLHRRVRYDEKFFFLTLPETKRGPPKVSSRGEIQVENVVYKAVELRSVKGAKPRVHVDPDDVGHVFAWVGKRWVECRSEWYSKLRGRSWQQVRIASMEIRNGSGKKGAGRTTAVTAHTIAALLEDAHRYEKLQVQIDRDAARKEAEQARSKWPPGFVPPGSSSQSEVDSALPSLPDVDDHSDDTRPAWSDRPVLKELF